MSRRRNYRVRISPAIFVAGSCEAGSRPGSSASGYARSGTAVSRLLNGGGDCVEVALAWRKSSYSGQGGGDCVEVAAPETLHLARDSKDPSGTVLAFAPAEWSAFVARVKQNEHELP
ncbi:DUF397 domain-containing protein [Actinomadura sp. 6N118]|uniref:DUF397 domain-containing protein n=1 Tax=Actinomadura sp. 6N118 TaxID=3375151 RepID=UPI0037B319ED